MTFSIIGRKTWGARFAGGFADVPLPAQHVWLHHSVTIAPDLDPPFTDDDAAIRTLERIGQERFGGGISYTFAITPVGRVYEGHGVGRRGAHTLGRNSIDRAICLVGDYDTHPVTPAQVEAAAQLLVAGWRQGWWRLSVLAGGHRDAPGNVDTTLCPGRYGQAAVTAINRRAAAIRAGAPPAPKEDEMSAQAEAEIKEILRIVKAFREEEKDRYGVATGRYGDLRALAARDDVDEQALADDIVARLTAALNATAVEDADAIQDAVTAIMTGSAQGPSR